MAESTDPNPAAPVPGLPERILLGAAYYTEYQPYERLEADLDLMAAGGFGVIRVGESVWSTWEPRDGVFDLDWLQPVLDGAHARGIAVVVGTPTYAVPPWLRKTYPETTAHSATGVEIPYGMRQDVDYSHPTFRYLAERVVRKIVGRYADHPAVIGWQVDNEPGHKIFYNPQVFAGFVEHLKDTYGTVDELNRRWGLTYWSHRIADWSELWTPDGNSTPSYDLAWRRYQATLGHDLIRWQTDLVRSLVPADQFVTTCIALGQQGQDITVIGEPLDVAGANLYYATQDGLELPGAQGLEGGLASFFVPWSGPAYLSLQADTARGTRQAPFLVTETNATSIGGTADNFPAYDGQWRQTAWHMVARGARLLNYWHWHTLHYGAETYWGGILGHSLEPGRTYAELSRVANELTAATDALAGLEPVSDVGVLVGAESRWAMECMGPLAGPAHSWMGDPGSYDRILAAFYRGLFDAGLAADIVSPGQLADVGPGLPDDAAAAALVARWRVLVVPGLYIADDATLDLLRRYAEAGGHLVLTPRTGYADADAVVRSTVAPGVLRGAAGVHYLEYTNLVHPVPVTGAGWTGAGTAWADGLLVDDAEVLAGYDHPHLGQFAAVTTRVAGAGRVTTVGTVPDRELAGHLARYLARTSLPVDPWRDARPETVTVTAAVNAAGERLRFVHNWSWEPATYRLPAAVRDVLDDVALAAGELLALGPWDVRVLRETP
ncbi:beta-galactosidase [Pengzhenrongella frigida]|uniref:beta-galactosidase n=1 Tax=Pengzhenrongella frigida TaxID=1259133 RepID=A0A4Q5MYN5_9MICO|nr:beta-galactosidase [Cellulomonas sp. HLT2-17]RYV50789.1 beta-galactosidase [Cellulomonas sp. HLT2-17]